MLRLVLIAIAFVAHGSAIAQDAGAEPSGHPVEEAPAPEEPVGPLGVTETPPPPIDQAEPTPPKKRPIGHLRVGGGLGFGLSSNFIYVDVSPSISYIFKKRIEPGTRFIYQYTKDRVPGPDIRGHTVGGSLFLRAYLISTLFAEIEGLLLNTGFKQAGVSFPRETFGNVLVGGGYLIPLGRSAFAALSVKVNVIKNALYPEIRPFLSFGIGAQF